MISAGTKAAPAGTRGRPCLTLPAFITPAGRVPVVGRPPTRPPPPLKTAPHQESGQRGGGGGNPGAPDIGCLAGRDEGSDRSARSFFFLNAANARVPQKGNWWSRKQRTRTFTPKGSGVKSSPGRRYQQRHAAASAPASPTRGARARPQAG